MTERDRLADVLREIEVGIRSEDEIADRLIAAGVVMDAVSPEAFAVESPLDFETIRAAFLVLRHAGFRVVPLVTLTEA